MPINYLIIALCFTFTLSYTSDDPLDLLRLAVHENDGSLVRQLLLQNPNLDLNNQVCETTLLSTAVTKATPIIIKQLIKHGACVHTQEHDGNTPLHIACLFGKIPAIKILLNEGANPLAQNNKNITPLHYAVSAQSHHVCAQLLPYIKNVDPVDHNGRTPLMWAIDHKYIRHINTLLHAGASLKVQDTKGITPLHMAAKSLNSVQFLLNKGANPKLRDNRKAIPLHFAACKSKLNCVKELIPCSDINAQDQGGVTPLFVSILFNHEDIALLLLRKGANPNIIAQDSFPPLHTAVKIMPSLVPELFRYGADPFAHNLGRQLIKQTKNKLTRHYLIGVMKKMQLESCLH